MIGRAIGVILDYDGAVCATRDSVFLATDDAASVAVAKRICMVCPVRLDCLSIALEHNLLDGVWGGLTTAERSRYSRRAAPDQDLDAPTYWRGAVEWDGDGPFDRPAPRRSNGPLRRTYEEDLR